MLKLHSRSLSRNSRPLDETTRKYLGFEMMKGGVERNETMSKLEERIKEKLDEAAKIVEVSETRNRIQYINQNSTGVVRFYSGTLKFALGWLDRIDMTIRHHLTQQGMLMKRGMSSARLYTSQKRHWAVPEKMYQSVPA